MTTKRKRRAGRPRKSIERHPGGKVIQTRETILPETIARRAERVGMENARHERAGFPLGELRLCNEISEREFRAGRILEDRCLKWASLAGLPKHYAMSGERDQGIPVDCDADTWSRSKRDMNECLAIIAKLPRCELVSAALTSVILDVFMPHAWMRPRAVAVLREGLAALADYFKIEVQEAA